MHDSQNAGETRQRTDRLHTFSSLDEVEETLTWFIEYPHGPLVWRFGSAKTARSRPSPTSFRPPPQTAPAAADNPAENEWRAAIEARLASLESEIAELKARQPRDSSISIRKC